MGFTSGTVAALGTSHKQILSGEKPRKGWGKPPCKCKIPMTLSFSSCPEWKLCLKGAQVHGKEPWIICLFLFPTSIMGHQLHVRYAARC